MTTFEIISAIRAIVNGQEPQSDILQLLHKHRCASLIRTLKGTTISGEVANKASMDFLNRMAVNERFRVLRPFFEDTTERYAIIKGAPLSLVMCGDPYARYSGDIDILINKVDSNTIKNKLFSLGFVQGYVSDGRIVPFSRKNIVFQVAMTHQLAPFVKRTENPLCPFVVVDINTDIMWGESSNRVNIGAFLTNTTTMCINNVKFSKLTPEAEFISLCLHHYKDINSIYLLYERGIYLSHFFDVFYYIINSNMDKHKLLSLSIDYKVGEYIYYCLYYTNVIFNSKNLDEYLEIFEPYRNVELINSFGLNDSERKAWNCEFFERLFADDMQTLLKKHLTVQDIRKIEANEAYM